MTINILFLDDNETRHELFGACLAEDHPDAKVLHVRTAAEACQAIDKHPELEIVFLDHDLDERDTMCEPGVGSFALTGMHVVDHIAQIIRDRPSAFTATVVVHTCNPPAGREMVKRLADVGYTNVMRCAFPDLPFIKRMLYPGAR